MITHIVMFRFVEGVAPSSIDEAKSKIESLMGRVPTLVSMEVGINFADEGRAMDMSLLSRFDSKEGLDAYAIHPDHVEVVQFIKTIAEYSKVVDYETQG